MRRLMMVAVAVGILAGCGRAPIVSLPERAAGPPPADRRRVFADAVEFITRERFADAVPQFQALVQSYPELADYHLYYWGLALSRSGRPAEAAVTLRRLLADHPRSVHRDAATLEIGRAEAQLGHVAAAREALQAAADAHDRALAQQAGLELARADLRAGDPYGAAAILQRLRREAAGKDIGGQAKAELHRLWAIHPDLIPTGAARTDELRLLVHERDFPAAETLAGAALAAAGPADRAELQRLYAEVLLGLGRLDDALSELRLVARSESGPAASATLFRIGSILWNRDRDDEALTTFSDLRRRYPRAPRSTEALYAIGRIHEKAGRIDQAVATYRELARGAPRDKLAREAQWRIGWIHYTQGNWKAAAQGFAALARCGDADACADALYWQARTLAHQGREASAAALYRRVVSEAPTSYYAQWAEQRLGLKPPPPTQVAPPAVATTLPGSDYHLQRAIELKESGLRAWARAELAAYEREHDGDVAALRRLLHWYPAVDGDGAALRLTRRLGSQAGLSAEERQRVFYPLGFWPAIQAAINHSDHAAPRAMDPLLVAALIRQESLYDPDAHSPADAYGLMQLLPSTAQRVAGAPVSTAALCDPERNIALGTRYLAQLLSQFGGDELKALAAYNGGEAAVEKWQRRFAGRERDEFVESITFRETRDYVKKVIGGYRQYRRLYGTVGGSPGS